MQRKQLGIEHYNHIEKFPINFVYFYEESPFDECVEFMNNLKKICNINVINYQPEASEKIERYNVMKNGLDYIIQKHEMKAIILGTRRTDPYASSLKDFSPSDSSTGWPEFVRVNPILNWRYYQIWDFLKSNGLAYPTPYDEGYTYLGEKEDSIRNPFLYHIESNTYHSAQNATDNFETLSRKKNGREMIDHKILINPNEIWPIITENYADITEQDL